MLEEAWFIPPFLALIAGVLALAPLGVQVLGRGVVFIDLAVAQAAAAAALAALLLREDFSWAQTQLITFLGALGATGVIALLSRLWPQQREALIGLLYITCACIALLTARADPHGAEHLHALLAADVLWAGWQQVGWMAFCATVVTLLKRRLKKDWVFYTVFALVASFAVQILGLFVVFSTLIAPALWQRAGLSLKSALCLAWLAAWAGLALSWWLDVPSGPMVALSLALLGGCAATRQRRIKARLF